MGPLRLLLLTLFGYLAWRLLYSQLREKIKNELRQKEQKKETKVEDVLEEDPVCHTLVPRSQAVRLLYNGKTYYFCSETCCDIFTERQQGAVT